MTVRDKFNALVKELVEKKVITESQSTSFEPIVDQFEKLVKESEDRALKAAAQVSESKLEAYDKEVSKQLVETFKRLSEHNAVEKKLAVMKESKRVEKRITESVDAYLDEYISKLLPEQKLVDYHRLQRLENMFESFKRTLMVNDKAIVALGKKIVESVEEKVNAEEEDSQKKITELSDQVAELLAQKKKLQDDAKARERDAKLSEKLKDVPALEASKVRKYFESEDADSDTIEKEFDDVLVLIKKALDVTDREVPTAKSEIDDKIKTIIGVEDEDGDEEEVEDEEEEEEEEEEVTEGEEEVEDDVELEVEEKEDSDDEEEEESKVKKESVKVTKGGKRLHESTLMRSYINNLKKFNI